MTNREKAELAHAARCIERCKKVQEEALIENLTTSFSAIATCNPNLALDILKQLGEQLTPEGVAEKLEAEENQKQEFFKAVGV